MNAVQHADRAEEHTLQDAGEQSRASVGTAVGVSVGGAAVGATVGAAVKHWNCGMFEGKAVVLDIVTLLCMAPIELTELESQPMNCTEVAEPL
jgi:hypothetical protein